MATCRLSLAPDMPSSWGQLGLTLARSGRYAEAEDACRRALALNPHQAEAWHTLGNVAYLKGDAAEAERMWKRALAEDPRLTGVAQSLASLRRQGAARRR